VFKKKVKPKQNTNLTKFTDKPVEERISILEMLLWKNHVKGIPKDVASRLVNNHFLENSSSGGLIWSAEAHELDKRFNKEFNYE